ncbi:MAG: hypothetical protein GXP58_11210 [Deltaproteobacteria bacterium]|nr:hypothetical protein [Deltaproteobacteria bacterium]
MSHSPILRAPIFRTLFFMLFVPILFSRCSKIPEKEEASVVARVNGEPILQAELDREILHIDNSFSLPVERKPDRKFSEEILRRMIRRRLLLQEAKKLGMTLSGKEAAKMVAERKGDLSRKDLETLLKNTNHNYDEWKKGIIEDALIERLIQQQINAKLHVSDEELIAYYEAHPKEFDLPERVHVRQIVVAKKEEAEKIRKRLVDGKEDFALVAVEVSLSPDAEQGGDIGTFARGQMPPEFDKTCFALEVGEISPVVKSPYGYHLFRVEQHFPAGRQTFKEARKELYKKFMARKREEAFEHYQEKLWNQSEIIFH